MNKFLHGVKTGYSVFLRSLALGMVVLSGVGLLGMVAVTCLDIVLRRFNCPFTGAYDIVKVLGALTLAFALPYTTAIKGHVAIEYFFQKLNRTGRIVVDTLMRVLAIVLFLFLAYRSVLYGNDMLHNGQVTQTLQMPICWVPWVIGVCCFTVVLVIAHNLTHTGKEMINP